MLNENAKKWVAALRSGKYTQGKYALCNRGKYCCLGVACEVAIENGVPLNVRVNGVTKSYDERRADLPVAVKEWLGLATPNGVMGYPDDFPGQTLTGLNDSRGKTFEDIADIIESEPEGLFAAL